MAIQSMSEYFKGNPKSSLGRIFIAHTIEQELEKLFNVKVRVLMKPQNIVFECSSQAQAALLSMNRPKLYGLISRFGDKNRRVKIITKLS